MSVPAALMTILTLGPAYGLQLHAELASRLPHRDSTNVGQIYSTLERLTRDGFVVRSGETTDGLPLYDLTEKGRQKSFSWMAGNDLTTKSPWTEIMDVLLVDATIERAPLTQACDHVETLFEIDSSRNEPSVIDAQEHLNRAILATVADIRRAITTGTLPHRDLDEKRPTRGRRPRSLSTS